MAHAYSTSSKEHRRVPFFLAAAAIASAFVLGRLLDHYKITFEWWFSPPIDAMAFYGFFFWLFDHWIWKWSLLHRIRIVCTPVLNGQWTGHVESSHHDSITEGLVDIDVDIEQTWTEMLITASTTQSTSHSLWAAIVTTEPCTLSYEYINDPRPDTPPTMHIHRGTARLAIDRRTEELKGDYYSGRDRENTGSISLCRRKESRERQQ